MQEQPHDSAQRVQNHRERAILNGLKRVEVKVPEGDERLIRSVAKKLRGNDEIADLIRKELRELLPSTKTKNTLEFFQSSPLADIGDDLVIERDPDTGRSVSF